MKDDYFMKEDYFIRGVGLEGIGLSLIISIEYPIYSISTGPVINYG